MVATVSVMEMTSKSILYVSHVYRLSLQAQLSLKENTLKKHSVLLFESSSDSDGEGNGRKTTETNNEGVSSNKFFDVFHNKFTKKDA